MSPTSLTLRFLRNSGYSADVCERWIAQARIRKDLFGCIDIIAVHRCEPGVLAMQATSLPNLGARLAKARSKAELKVWLRAGGRFEVWGWSQRAGRWHVQRVAVQAEALVGVAVQAVSRRWRAKQREFF
jgi:hypothetical protein